MKNRKFLSLFLIILTLGLAVGAVYIGYYLNQSATTPTDINAGAAGGSCCAQSVGCVTGYRCDVSLDCDNWESLLVGSGVSCSGTWVADRRCRSLPGVTSTCELHNGVNMCHLVGNNESTVGSCVQDAEATPPSGCSITCEWPDVTVSNRCGFNSGTPTCSCHECDGTMSCSQASSSHDYYTGCSSAPAKCDPPGCPSGYTSCGTSGDSMGAGCTKYSNLKCSVYAQPCGNVTNVYRYCKSTVVTTVPVTTTIPVTTTVPVTTTAPVTTHVVITTTLPVTTRVIITTTAPATTGVTITVTQPIITVTTTVTPTLPSMALISDKADRLIGGILLVMTGLAIYSFGLHQSIGNLFWKLGGNKILPQINKTYNKQKVSEIRKAFGKKISKDK